jgi:DNA-binding NarL/FixJ family response regulator
MQGDSTTVLAADDHDGFRETLRALVDATSGFELIGEASSGEQAVQLAGRLTPDVVLLDVNMPGIGGIAAARDIVATLPDTVVALISGRAVQDLPADAWSCGAHAVLTKDVLRPQVLARLRDRV